MKLWKFPWSMLFFMNAPHNQYIVHITAWGGFSWIWQTWQETLQISVKGGCLAAFHQQSLSPVWKTVKNIKADTSLAAGQPIYGCPLMDMRMAPAIYPFLGDEAKRCLFWTLLWPNERVWQPKRAASTSIRQQWWSQGPQGGSSGALEKAAMAASKRTLRLKAIRQKATSLEAMN